MQNEKTCDKILTTMMGKEKILDVFRIEGVTDYFIEDNLSRYIDDDDEDGEWDEGCWSAKLDFINEQEEFITGVFLGYSIDDTYGDDAIKLLEELSKKGVATRYKKWRKVYDITKEYGDCAWSPGVGFKLIKGGIKISGWGVLGNDILDLTLGKSRCLFDNDLVLRYDSLEHLKTMLELVGKNNNE